MIHQKNPETNLLLQIAKYSFSSLSVSTASGSLGIVRSSLIVGQQITELPEMKKVFKQ